MRDENRIEPLFATGIDLISFYADGAMISTPTTSILALNEMKGASA
jgi:hypothetical protein